MLPVCSYCLHDWDAALPKWQAFLFTAPDCCVAHLLGFRVASKVWKISSANFYNLLTFSAVSDGLSIRVAYDHDLQPPHSTKLWLIAFFYLLLIIQENLLCRWASYGVSCVHLVGEKNLKDVITPIVLHWRITLYIKLAAITFGITSCSFRPCPRYHQSSCHYPMKSTVCF